MMGHRYKCRTGDERDAVSRACRKILVFLGRAGVTAAIKAGISCRLRREAKRELSREDTA